jgi:hypothetical protein
VCFISFILDIFHKSYFLNKEEMKAQRGPSAVQTVVVALHEPAGQLRAPQLHLLHVGGQQLARVAKVTRREATTL